MVTIKFHVSVQPKKEENPSVKEQELLFFYIFKWGKNAKVNTPAFKEVKFSLDSKVGIPLRGRWAFSVYPGAMGGDSPVVLIFPKIWYMSYNVMKKGENGGGER